MSFNSGSNPFATQFGLKSKIPLDCRFVIENATELIQMIDIALYPGLRFVVQSTVTIDDDTIKSALDVENVPDSWDTYKRTYCTGFYIVDIDGATLLTDVSVDRAAPTEGLSFTRIGETETCYVSKGSWDGNGHLIIPKYSPTGMEVVAIGFSEDSTGAFAGCAVESVTIPDTIVDIHDKAFWNCKTITQFNIPGSVRTIGHRAFAGCDNLAEVFIEEGLTTIGSNAFYYDFNLRKINIPRTVTTIGTSAFGACMLLKNINIPNSVITMGSMIFPGIESTLVAYCEHDSKPDDWADDWWLDSYGTCYWGINLDVYELNAVQIARDNLPGAIQLGYSSDETNRAVNISDSNQAYVNVPLANGNSAGLIKEGADSGATIGLDVTNGAGSITLTSTAIASGGGVTGIEVGDQSATLDGGIATIPEATPTEVGVTYKYLEYDASLQALKFVFPS